ncbi:TolC family protein [Malaciobacter mytili]|uniref:Transporter n=1 Tax=Malaciobacter mytili LMG 24559 TaxID=1032238 RepID=A0AAX2AG80_9BACT|nr:TolC family protein [Malaciobacter mytili]AXH14885.1 RND family efflux system, outer membrane channel protein, TolC family [Malaciobacter mytili LMG 24559]RXI42676.1 transporter [Malaciobacter mytili]RXK13693.1 transporter [Malaciobacter mytili LMG 24559]
MKKIYLLFFIPIFLMGQDLNELIDLSIKNRLVNSYKNDLESLKKEYSSVRSSYLPKLDVGANYSKAKYETASTASKSSTAYASLDFTLYDGGKRENRFDSYEMSIKSSEKTLESIKNQISLDVTTYYYNYLGLFATQDAKIKEIEQLRAQYDRLSKFLEVGTTTEDELKKIDSRLQSATVQLHEIELQLQTILHNLEYITGKKVSIQEGSLVDLILTNDKNKQRADIESLKFNVETMLKNADIEKSGYLPTISLNNTYSYYDMNFDNKAFENDLDEQNILSINLKWNIFSFGETKNSYESKYKKYLSAKSNYEYEKNKANVDLQLALRAFDIGKLKIKSAQASLDAANSAYEVIKSKFQNGLIDNVAYLEALSEKYDALSVLKTAIYDLEIKKANVIYHSGEKVKDYVK